MYLSADLDEDDKLEKAAHPAITQSRILLAKRQKYIRNMNWRAGSEKSSPIFYRKFVIEK